MRLIGEQQIKMQQQDRRKGEVSLQETACTVNIHASVKEAMTHAGQFIFSGDSSVTYEYFPRRNEKQI